MNNNEKIIVCPKRRHSKDNPYRIFSTGTENEGLHYYVSFVDCLGKNTCMEIDKELFDMFDKFELEDLSYLNEVDNHLCLHNCYDEDYEGSIEKYYSSEDEYFKEELFNLIQSILPAVQRKYILMYFRDGYRINEIAKLEGKKYNDVRLSLQSAIRRIKVYLRKKE